MSVKSLVARLKQDPEVTANRGISPNQIHHFRALYGRQLPSDMYEYFQEMNGMTEDSLYSLARLWPLENLKPVTDYFWLPGTYNPKNSESLKTNVTIAEQGIYKLVMPLEDQQDVKFLLPHADEYFLFADYNIEGSHWAIRLDNDHFGLHSVIFLSDVVNIYREVSRSFWEFLTQFVERPEMLM